jgi:hypothetical protein
MNLQEAINQICEELNNTEINKQRKRYLENYLQELLEYQNHNPTIEEVPTVLQLFCDLNPEAPECKIYDV